MVRGGDEMEIIIDKDLLVVQFLALNDNDVYARKLLFCGSRT